MLYLILILIFSTFSYFGIGRSSICFLVKLVDGPFDPENRAIEEVERESILLEDFFFWTFGLLVHLWSALLLNFLNIGVQNSFFVSLIVLVGLSRSAQIYYFHCVEILIKKALKAEVSLSFIVYFCFLSLAGITCFSSDNGIRTIWANNYGDLPFHLGLISNFARNSEQLITYPIYPPAFLSYYFLFDFWTACLWVDPYNWRELSIICFSQWMICWLLVYAIFSKFRVGYFSYLLLFGGGSYAIFFKQLNALFNSKSAIGLLSHFYIEKGYPWTVFISTIWVPQRASIFGLVFLVSGLITFFSTTEKNQQTVSSLFSNGISRCYIFGIYFSLSLMAHFYFGIVGLFLIGFGILFRVLNNSYERMVFLRALVRFVGFTGIAILLPFLIFSQKQGLFRFVGSWMPWEMSVFSGPFSTNIFGCISMWLMNATVMIVIFILVQSKIKIHEYLGLIVLFLFFNFFQFSVWNWDNNKGFLALYCALVCYLVQVNNKRNISHFIILIFCLPALLEFSIILSGSKPEEVYSKQALYKADEISRHTSNSVILSQSNHNSIVTLAGRKIFIGYDGWLNSHGLDYQERKRVNDQFLLSQDPNVLKSSLNQPRYVFYPNGQKIKMQSIGKVSESNLVDGLYDMTDFKKR